MNIRKVRQAGDSEEKVRPILITICCLIGFVSTVISIELIPDRFNIPPISLRQIGNWYFAELLVTTIIGFCCFIGLWNMRKWAVYTYTALFIINQIKSIFTHTENVLAILIPGILIVIMWVYIKRMH